ncbi:alanine/glycine:cation symporter family protein [Azospirillum sp. SYSU D00513]|uniref:alanine/glycine:cation symporter family protein n=1 Tax=Azospirillum sp. SYSU D00513 TaxID=2812561 RepID=UPI001B3BDF91|nr:alanine/glycine:cation symporter family protein [Azospirillum sp. SYSU D00513]
MIDTVIAWMNTIIWNHLLIYLLLGAGLYFTVRSRFIQLRLFAHAWSALLGSRQDSEGGISSFQAFCIGLSSRVGTGNIAGVAIALTLGGPGAIFWMWMVALVGMATAFVEATLAQMFKLRQPDGTYRGGPAYYIERGLGSRFWGSVFAVLLIVTFGLTFNAVQANTIAATFGTAHGVPTIVTAGILVLLAAPVLFGGIRAVARVAEWLLPFMALAYLALTAVVLGMNVDRIPEAFSLIIRSAFGLDEAVAGSVGGIGAALLNGVKRGLFSNEAGMGSAPNAAATATLPHPASQGLVQAVGVFVDTIVICTATALIILVSGVYDPTQSGAVEGATLTQVAVSSAFGGIGTVFMSVVIFCFAFSSILGNYAYADGNLTYLGARSKGLAAFKVLVLLAIFGGCLGELPVVWALADTTMGLMALVNLVAILLLGRWAFGALRDYEQGRHSGAPVFNSHPNPHLPGRIGTGVWRREADAGTSRPGGPL